jgi:hypothetical protein
VAGADHSHKHDARRLLETFVADRRRLVSSAEVLHRYRAVDLVPGVTRHC